MTRRASAPRWRRAVAHAVAAGVLVTSTWSPAAAGETDGQWVTGFWKPGPQVESWKNPYTVTCSITAKIWVKEVGTSGISRFRVTFHQYGAYSPTSPWLALQSSNEVAYPADSDIELPDDDREFFISAHLPWGVFTGDSGQQVAARLVGERPSLWNPDVVEDLSIGELVCDKEACLNGYGIDTCPDNVRDGDVTSGGGIVDPNGSGNPYYKDSDQDGIPDDAEAPPPSGHPMTYAGM